MKTIYRWHCGHCGHIGEGTDRAIVAEAERLHKSWCDDKPKVWTAKPETETFLGGDGYNESSS